MTDPIQPVGVGRVTQTEIPTKETKATQYDEVFKKLKSLAYQSSTSKENSSSKKRVEKPRSFRKKFLFNYLLELADKKLKNKNHNYKNKLESLFAYLETIPSNESKEQIIGKWIYLIDKEPDLVKQALLFSSQQKSLNMLMDSFDRTFEGKKKILQKIYRSRSEESIIPSSLKIREQIPIFIAESILTSDGKINTGLIPYIHHTFLGEEGNQKNFSINIDYFLKLLLNSSGVRSKIEALEPPKVQVSPINIVLKTTLRKFDEQPLSKRDVQIATMSALLAHPRQGVEGNCFSQYLANILLVTNPNKCLLDFESLIDQSCLVREVNGEVHILPFLLKHTNEFMRTKVELKESGRWTLPNGKSNFLWNTQSFLTAAQALQIDNPKEVFKKIAEQKCKGKSVDLQIYDILFDLAKYVHASEKKNEELSSLISKASLAFSSESSNPLQSTWINAIANGAETHVTGKLKHYVTDTISSLLKNHSEDSDKLTKKLINEVNQQIEEGLRLFYDSSLGTSSRTGGFVLYLIHRKKKAKIRIDSPELFQEMISVLLESAKRQLVKEKKFHLKYRKQLNTKVKNLEKYVQSESFLVDATTHYQKISPFQTGNQGDYRSLNCSPWVNRAIGHDAAHILKVYFEMDKTPDCDHIQPSCGKELLSELLTYQKEVREHVQEIIQPNPYFRVPTRIIDQHAFSLLLNHNTFKTFFDLNSEERKLDLKNKRSQASVIKSFPPSLEYQKKVLDGLAKQVSNSSAPEKQVHFHLSPAGSLGQFRHGILQMLDALLSVPEGEREKILVKVDQLLWDSLPRNIKKEYGNQFIHIADTNWRAADGVEDLHYAIGMNPFTEGLELFEIRDTGEGLRFLPQTQYFSSSWELYKNPRPFLATEETIKKAPSFELSLLRTENL